MLLSAVNTNQQFHLQASEDRAESDRTEDTEAMSWGISSNKNKNNKDDSSEGDISSIIMDPITDSGLSKEGTDLLSKNSAKKRDNRRLTWFVKGAHSDNTLKSKEKSESSVITMNEQHALAEESAKIIEELHMKLKQRTDAIQNLESALTIQTDKIEILTNQLQQQQEREEESIREGVKKAIGQIYAAQMSSLQHVVTSDLGLSNAELPAAVLAANADYNGHVDHRLTAPQSPQSSTPTTDRFDRPPPSFLTRGMDKATTNRDDDGDDNYCDYSDQDSAASWSSPKTTSGYDNDDTYHSSTRQATTIEEEFSVTSDNPPPATGRPPRSAKHRTSESSISIAQFDRSALSLAQFERSGATVRDTDDDLEAFAEFNSRWDSGHSSKEDILEREKTRGTKKSLNHRSEHVRRTYHYGNDDDNENDNDNDNSGDNTQNFFGFKRRLGSTTHSR
mmetsp:Transcript_12515/g.19368  ORF Transcript_12515/g.19368 Transcript_12515/m.19368 type:complete len:449 (-) Transcript_12515:66-1412(-)